MKHVKVFLTFGLPILCMVYLGCKQDVKSVEPAQTSSLRTGIVPIAVAHDIAQDFFNLNSGGKQANKEIVSEETLQEKNQPYIYVYNFKDGGFLLLSAEYGDIPILAYSDRNPFDIKKPTNLGLNIWLGDTKNRIQQIRAKQITPEPASEELWNSYSNHSFKFEDSKLDSSQLQLRDSWRDCNSYSWTRTTTGPLLRTAWGQGCGYNNSVPEMVGGQYCGRPPTGCVATAMAQVARFHERPLGRGYSDMPNELFCWSGPCSTGETKLSALMSECGREINMNYGPASSGAWVSAIPSVFVRWGYRNAMTYTSLTEGTYSIGMVDKPIILAGYSTARVTFDFFRWTCYEYSDGHAWVCDGSDIMSHRCYSTTKSYSMNWGWGNNFNGFYGSPAPRYSNYNFQYNMHALSNINVL